MSNKTENTLKKGICLNCGEPLSLETSKGYCSRECVSDAFEKDVEETEITWTDREQTIIDAYNNVLTSKEKEITRLKIELALLQHYNKKASWVTIKKQVK